MNIDEILYPSRRYIKRTYNSAANINKHNNAIFVIDRAIVVNIDTDINNNAAHIIPPGSVQAFIIGVDIIPIDGDIQKIVKNATWYPPFHSLHNIAIPEIGEEVWIIKENINDAKNGYWFGRINDNNVLNKYLAREINKDQNPIDRYSLNLDVEKLSVDVTQSSNKTYSIPYQPGDVIQQGRTNTYVRHTFNKRNNNSGILEFGIKDNGVQYQSTTGVTIQQTKTKSIHAENCSIADLIPNNILANTLDKNNQYNVICNISDILVNISTASGSSNTLHRHVHGEKINDQLKQTLQTMRVMLQTIIQFAKTQHQHVIPSFSTNIIANIDIDGETRSINIDVNVPAMSTKPNDINISIISISEKLIAFIDNMMSNINSNLSRNQFIN